MDERERCIEERLRCKYRWGVVGKWLVKSGICILHFFRRYRKVLGVSFEILRKRFNHSSPVVTMRYLGIEDKEVNGILLNEI